MTFFPNFVPLINVIPFIIMKKSIVFSILVAMLMLLGHRAAAQEIPITLNPGWNWIGYYLPFEQPLTVALGTFTPEDGDIIKSQNSYSIYQNGRWYGSLTSFAPGLGYMYCSQRTTSITFYFNANPTVVVLTLTVTTAAPSEITETSAVSGGEVLCDDAGAVVSARGVCWGTSPSPTLEDNYIEVEGGLGTFSVTMDNLLPNTRYYVKAYAATPDSVYYGDQVTFRTKVPAPTAPTGALNGLFSVSATQQVFFSKGNLQYRASTNTWRFAENQYDCCGNGNSHISSTYNGWIDLFGWGTSGYDHGAVCYQPWSGGINASNYLAYGCATCALFDETGKADWGYNTISNGGNSENLWRTLTSEEYAYLLFQRVTASGARFAKVCVNGSNGILLLPDNWNNEVYSLSKVNNRTASFNSNVISAADWVAVEIAGAVFLPAAGSRATNGSLVYYDLLNSRGFYWASDIWVDASAPVERSCFIHFGNTNFKTGGTHRFGGLSVRLVQNAQ